MRRVPTSWVASGNLNSITDACIHFTQKFVKIRDGEPPGWHILQTFDWGRRRRRRLHEVRGRLVTPVGIVRNRMASTHGHGHGCLQPDIRRGGSVVFVSGALSLISGTVPGQWHRPSPAALFLTRGTTP